MPRYIFPAATGVATGGRQRFVRVYRTATATRPLEDLRNLDGDVDTTPIPSGRLVVLWDGSLQAFAGPDDLTTLWREVEGDETREAITATGPVAYTATALDAATLTAVATTPGNRLRRAAANALARNALDLGVMASPPTITVSPSTRGDSSLTNLYTAANDANANDFTHLGGERVQHASNIYWSYPAITVPSGGNVSATRHATSFAVEFYTDSSAVELMILNSPSARGFMIFVNDQAVSASPIAFGATNGGSYVLIPFGTSAVRKIRFESDEAAGFGRAYVKPTAIVWPSAGAPDLIRAAWVGDSFGTPVGASLAGGSWPFRAGKLLGWTDTRSISLGGTGFDSGAIKYSTASRLADVAGISPDVIVLQGSTNDDASAAAGTLAAAVTSTIAAYRAALPRVPLIVLGPSAMTKSADANRLANAAAVAAGVVAAADANTWHIPNTTDPSGSWITGTGYAGATTGTGNSDVVTSSDGAHPTQWGHDYLARRFAQAVRTLVLPSVA